MTGDPIDPPQADDRTRIHELAAQIQDERLKVQDHAKLIKELQSELELQKKATDPALKAGEMSHKPAGRKPRRVSAGDGAPRAGKSKEVAEHWAVNYPGADSKAARDAAAKVLTAVRTRAEAWRNGTAAVLGVITATLVIGGETYTAIREADEVVPWLIVIAAVVALVSLYMTLRAANGPAFLDTKIRETLEPSWKRDMRRAGAAAADLKRAQWMLGIAVIVFLVALLVLWHGGVKITTG